ncbi:MAG: hypothetical protein LIO99_08795 [Clostridiales bacterium]|nr:hypothetical protein [Clostridiales bacterium]
MMKQDLKFQTFFDKFGSEFLGYLDSAGKVDSDDIRYREYLDETAAIYEKYPNVRSVLDLKEPRCLSAEECEKLLTVIDDREAMESMERENIYFQGCADSIAYLRKLKMLKGQPD